MENLPFAIGFVYQCDALGSRVSSIKCDEFDRRIHAGTLGSTALPRIPVVVCILAIAIAPRFLMMLRD